MFDKVLIANRGEIALRVVRTCRELGIKTVAVHSTADADSLPVQLADQSVCIGPAKGKDSYAHPPAIIEAALLSGAQAIHPGYGYLSEDPDFPQSCADNDLTFIGPPPAVIADLGDKAVARRLMAEQGLPLLPGNREPVPTAGAALALAEEIGFPVIIKIAKGGGGIGMRVARDPEQFVREFTSARVVAQNIYGDSRVYTERYLERARHIEVQVLCDAHGNGIHLGTRDCTTQRRFQKLIEEAPAPFLRPETVESMAAAAVKAALGVGYTGVGTFEFLLDEEEQYYFMEVNCRLQVEHTVTEVVTGIDLVEQQLRVAAGEPLTLRQEDIRLTGHAIECRVNTEDPFRDFAPTPGTLATYRPPAGPFTRVDSHAFEGMKVSPDYDSLLAKVITWGADRDSATARMARAMDEFVVRGPGVHTTIPFHRAALVSDDFRAMRHTTTWAATLAPQPVDPAGQ